MLRLTNLPIPNHPGSLVTTQITYQEAVEMIKKTDTKHLTSHIGFPQVHAEVERAIGRPIKFEGRFLPTPVDGESFLTIRKKDATDSLRNCTWLLTKFEQEEVTTSKD
jgi:hypothetical protein